MSRIFQLDRNHLNNTIHPTAVIGEEVKLGANNYVGPFVVLQGDLTIGNGNWFGAGAILGAPPEVRSLTNESSRELPDQAGVVLGDNNVIREYAQIHQGWKGQTQIGNDCYLMNQVYVAHDCQLGNGVTMASSALLAGHVIVGDGANLGMGASVHQGLRVGPGSMVGMGSVVVKSVPLFSKFFGNPGRIRGANTVGMQRMGFSDATIELVTRYLTNSEDYGLIEELEQCEEIKNFL